MDLISVLAIALFAGAAIPAGGALALWAEARPGRLGPHVKQGVVAFGGGVLVAAVALVLVPQGADFLAAHWALASFALGGLAFAALDRVLERGGGSRAQTVAMMTDFLPEALALGMLLATGAEAGPLLALLIALQNLPEGFNAFEEARGQGAGASGLLARFGLLSLLGPLMAWLGHDLMRESPELMGAIMLFAAGGILFLMFQDIAPEAHADVNEAMPAVGAVAGFLLGLAGHLYIG